MLLLGERAISGVLFLENGVHVMVCVTGESKTKALPMSWIQL